jgi:hypothetical protein
MMFNEVPTAFSAVPVHLPDGRIIHNILFRGESVGWHCGDDVVKHLANMNDTYAETMAKHRQRIAIAEQYREER